MPPTRQHKKQPGNNGTTMAAAAPPPKQQQQQPQQNGGSDRQQRPQPGWQASQQQQQQQPPAGNDDLMPSAPPAFPQPVSSLPRDDMQFYSGQLGRLPGSSIPPQQQHQQQQWLLTANGLQPPGSAASGAAAVTVMPVDVAAGAAQFGYPVDGMPLSYDVAMAPYTAVYAGHGYGNDAALPLLTDSAGFAGDMVFANRQMRHAFLRKVLGLVTLQLLLTAGVAAPLLSHKAVRRFLHANPWAFFVAAVLTATLLLVLACSEATRRTPPTNALLLAAFTLVEGVMVGAASATYQTHVLVVGLLISAAVCLALIAYASQTSADFSAAGGMLFSALVVLGVVSLAEHFLGFKTLHLLEGGCGALLFCAYTVYDVQLLASGDSGYALSADEYVFGAINVYTDVITMGLHVLQVCGQLQGDADDNMQ